MAFATGQTTCLVASLFAGTEGSHWIGLVCGEAHALPSVAGVILRREHQSDARSQLQWGRDTKKCLPSFDLNCGSNGSWFAFRISEMCML